MSLPSTQVNGLSSRQGADPSQLLSAQSIRPSPSLSIPSWQASPLSAQTVNWKQSGSKQSTNPSPSLSVKSLHAMSVFSKHVITSAQSGSAQSTRPSPSLSNPSQQRFIEFSNSMHTNSSGPSTSNTLPGKSNAIQISWFSTQLTIKKRSETPSSIVFRSKKLGSEGFVTSAISVCTRNKPGSVTMKPRGPILKSKIVRSLLANMKSSSNPSGMTTPSLGSEVSIACPPSRHTSAGGCGVPASAVQSKQSIPFTITVSTAVQVFASVMVTVNVVETAARGVTINSGVVVADASLQRYVKGGVPNNGVTDNVALSPKLKHTS